MILIYMFPIGIYNVNALKGSIRPSIYNVNALKGSIRPSVTE